LVPAQQGGVYASHGRQEELQVLRSRRARHRVLAQAMRTVALRNGCLCRLSNARPRTVNGAAIFEAPLGTATVSAHDSDEMERLTSIDLFAEGRCKKFLRCRRDSKGRGMNSNSIGSCRVADRTVRRRIGISIRVVEVCNETPRRARGGGAGGGRDIRSTTGLSVGRVGAVPAVGPSDLSERYVTALAVRSQPSRSPMKVAPSLYCKPAEVNFTFLRRATSVEVRHRT